MLREHNAGCANGCRVFLEGDRAFDIIWGSATGAISLALAIPILWWTLPEHRRSFFGPNIDPTYRLQLGYGLLAMAMSATNLLCRFIPHGLLAYVHPTFAFITLVLVLGLGPRIAYVALRARRKPQAVQAVHAS
jgi:hypothetical protein